LETLAKTIAAEFRRVKVEYGVLLSRPERHEIARRVERDWFYALQSCPRETVLPLAVVRSAYRTLRRSLRPEHARNEVRRAIRHVANAQDCAEALLRMSI